MKSIFSVIATDESYRCLDKKDKSVFLKQNYFRQQVLTCLLYNSARAKVILVTIAQHRQSFENVPCHYVPLAVFVASSKDKTDS